MIAYRYIATEILWPAIAGFLLLTLIFCAYSAVEVLDDAVAGRIAPDVVVQLIALRALTAADVLLPTAIYLSTVWGLVRLERDSELVVLITAGLSPMRLMWPVFLVALFTGLLILVIAVYAKPWAYRLSEVLENNAVPKDISALEPGRFYSLGGRFTLLAASVDGDEQVMRDVFVERPLSDEAAEVARRDRGFVDRHYEVIRAQELRVKTGADDQRQLEFRDGYAYRIRSAPQADRVHQFSILRYRAQPPVPQEAALNRKARPLAVLWEAREAKPVAELQWRLMLAPLASVTMLMACPLILLSGKGRQRDGVYGRLVMGIVFYLLVFNIAALTRALVENGTWPMMPGLWWLPVLPVLLFALYALAKTFAGGKRRPQKLSPA